MSFDYDKLKEEVNENFWTAYADLFMVLSTVFLLLYVMASLRSGSFGIEKQTEFKKLAAENADLRQQIKVYNTLKDDYLESGASEDDKQVYNQLMDKLSLLKEEQKAEKDDLRAQARENEKKEDALNQYQQIIRNIVNANMMAQTRIKSREDTISKIKKHSREKVGELEERRREVYQQLMAKNQDLRKIEEDLAGAKGTIAVQEKTNEQLQANLSSIEARHNETIEKIQADYKSKVSRERREFEKRIGEQQLTAAAKAEELDKFKARASSEAGAYEKNLAAARADASKEIGGYKSKLAELGTKFKATEDSLKEAQEVGRARERLAARIKENFAKAGLQADVDPKTGDVILNFGEEYFNTGKHNLKKGMVVTLEKFVPVYARSLFEDKEIARKLASVEIIGFASPTYGGQYVDPKSLDPELAKAVNYNLDLSYYRARSIFNHIFDTKKMTYKYQKNLREIVKVTGRSFLAENNSGRSVASPGQKEFCHVYNCKKGQRVIMKFNLAD